MSEQDTGSASRLTKPASTSGHSQIQNRSLEPLTRHLVYLTCPWSLKARDPQDGLSCPRAGAVFFCRRFCRGPSENNERPPLRRRPGLPQADHLADSVDQQREQRQGNDEVFDTIAALLFELTIEISWRALRTSGDSAFRRRWLQALLSRAPDFIFFGCHAIPWPFSPISTLSRLAPVALHICRR